MSGDRGKRHAAEAGCGLLFVLVCGVLLVIGLVVLWSLL